MSLFSQDGNNLSSGKEIITCAATEFNNRPGYAYSVEACLNEDNLEKCCTAFEAFRKLGFPSDPGPFKRLGSFAVISQIWSPFEFTPTHKSAACDQLHLVWGPRLTVWALPFLSRAIEINGDGPCIEEFSLPTPHFQVEFITYLRNIAYGNTFGQASNELLLERSTATGLLIEACAYSGGNQCVSKQKLQERASGCLEDIQKDPLLFDDLKFNDPEFWQLAMGMGIED